MPYIECHIVTGLSQPRKAKLIGDIVKVTHESIGSDPKIINVILHEHPEHNMAVSGHVYGEASKSVRPGSSDMP
jgi:4-oxalocrotonate tautomerase family enzyme